MKTNTSSQPPGQEQLFLAALTAARNAKNTADCGSAVAKHMLGVIVLDVRDEARFGTSAVVRLGRELRISEKTLYRYASVAERWTSKEFAALASKVDAKGRMLRWSHWERLATVADAKLREVLLAQALSQSLSVRGLSRAIKESVPGYTEPANAAPASKAKTTTRRLVRLLSSLEAKAHEVDHHVVADSAASFSKPTASELSELAALSKQIEVVVASLETLSDHVKQFTERKPHKARSRSLNKVPAPLHQVPMTV
jgi:hypothetical protein